MTYSDCLVNPDAAREFLATLTRSSSLNGIRLRTEPERDGVVGGCREFDCPADLQPCLEANAKAGRGVWYLPNELDVAAFEAAQHDALKRRDALLEAGDKLAANKVDVPWAARDCFIKTLRALFADFDGGFPEQWHLTPHLLVYSSIKDGVQRGQALWLIEPMPATDDNVRRWREAQARLIAYYPGADKSIKNPSRVLRLPGSLHVKREPRLVTFKQMEVF
jgi:hypothetical protein